MGVDVYTSRLNGSSSTGRTTVYLDTDNPPMSPEEVLEKAKEDCYKWLAPKSTLVGMVTATTCSSISPSAW